MAIRSNRELLEGRRRRRRLGSLGPGVGRREQVWGAQEREGFARSRRESVCPGISLLLQLTGSIGGARGAGGSRLVHRSVVVQ